MNIVAEVFHEHCRIGTLRLLEKSPGYAANASVLATGLCVIGLTVSRDQVATELAWLEEQRLITVERVPGDGKVILVAKLTERGMDVATGRAIVPGVKRPSPGG